LKILRLLRHLNQRQRERLQWLKAHRYSKKFDNGSLARPLEKKKNSKSGQPGGVVGNDGQIGHVQGIDRHNQASQRIRRAQAMIVHPARLAPTNGRARVITLAPSVHGAAGVPGAVAALLEGRNLTMLIEEINGPQKGHPRVKTLNEVNEEPKTAPKTSPVMQIEQNPKTPDDMRHPTATVLTQRRGKTKNDMGKPTATVPTQRRATTH
tara:strand:+ start:300 stop:926 length:627 start_codon:yes stop_codon:yes gene_type:complete